MFNLGYQPEQRRVKQLNESAKLYYCSCDGSPSARLTLVCCCPTAGMGYWQSISCPASAISHVQSKEIGEIAPWCHAHGVGILAHSVLGKGL